MAFKSRPFQKQAGVTGQQDADRRDALTTRMIATRYLDAQVAALDSLTARSFVRLFQTHEERDEVGELKGSDRIERALDGLVSRFQLGGRLQHGFDSPRLYRF